MDMLSSIVALQQVAFRQDLGVAVTKQAAKADDAAIKLVESVLQTSGSVDIVV